MPSAPHSSNAATAAAKFFTGAKTRIETDGLASQYCNAPPTTRCSKLVQMRDKKAILSGVLNDCRIVK